MKLFIRLLITVFFSISLVIFPTLFFCSEANANQDLFFVVDLSKSMKREYIVDGENKKIIDNIKKAMKEHINEIIKRGDYVAIYSFETDVNKPYIIEDITGTTDIARLCGVVDDMQATGEWTYMTKALDVVAKALKKRQVDFPSRVKRIFILTDGKNEPPPDIGESAITIDNIIDWHFGTFSQENSFIYIVTLGIEPKDVVGVELEKIGEKVVAIKQMPDEPITIEPSTTTTEILPSPKITLEPKKFSLNKIPLRKFIEKELEFEISRLNRGEGITLSFEIKAVKIPKVVSHKLDFNHISINEQGQKFKAKLRLSDAKEGSYEFKLSPKLSDPNATIVPDSIPVEFTVVAPIFKVTTSDLPRMTKNDEHELLVTVSADKLFAGKECKVEVKPDKGWESHLGFNPSSGNITLADAGSEAEGTFTTRVKAMQNLPWLGKAEYKILIDDPQEFKGNVSGTMPPSVRIGILISVIVLLLVIFLITYYKFLMPKFPRRAHLIHLDARNFFSENKKEIENRQWNLSKYQKTFRNKLTFSGDLKVSGMGKDTFCLIARRNGVYLQTTREVTDSANNKIEDTIRGHKISTEDIFIIEGEPFKYKLT